MAKPSQRQQGARAVGAYLAELEAAYEAPPGDDRLARRLSGWKAGADMCALLYLLVAEIRRLRADLAAARGEATPR